MRLHQLELSQSNADTPEVPTASTFSDPISGSHDPFDISKYITLVPTFRETEVDSYFGAFERIAAALKWPSVVWPLLLQCMTYGKAQEVVSALPPGDSLDYDSVRSAILCA